MNVTADRLPALMMEELEAGNKEFGPFCSLHEAYAVTREEIEEAREELDLIDTEMKWLWDKIRKNHLDKSKPAINANLIRAAALRGAAEMIQVAAMAQKTLDFIHVHDGEPEEAKHHEQASKA